jgi:rhodanese-related sulfurtransferase
MVKCVPKGRAIRIDLADRLVNKLCATSQLEFMDPSIDVLQLYSLSEARDPFFVLDVREYPEYAAGRIPGAYLIPYRELQRRRDEIPRDQPVYVVCQAGVRSRKAQRRLRRMGFAEVCNVEGGLRAWQAAGYGVKRDRCAPWPLERQERVAAGALVLMSVLLGIFVAPPFAWLGAVVGVALSLAAILDSCALEMLMARLPWNQQPVAASAANDSTNP